MVPSAHGVRVIRGCETLSLPVEESQPIQWYKGIFASNKWKMFELLSPALTYYVLLLEGQVDA